MPSSRATVRAANRRREVAERLGRDPGECGTCRYRSLVSSRRSVFLRCGLSDLDPGFGRYPELPVRGCSGFEAEERDEPRSERCDP